MTWLAGGLRKVLETSFHGYAYENSPSHIRQPRYLRLGSVLIVQHFPLERRLRPRVDFRHRLRLWVPVGQLVRRVGRGLGNDRGELLLLFG
jgi:hypothetical protein